MKKQEEIVEQDVEEELASARSLREKLLRLFEDMDYITLMAHMQAHLDIIAASCFIPPSGLDSVVNGIYNQGKVAGYHDAMNYAKLLLQGAEGTIAQLEPLEVKDNFDGA